MGCIEGVESVLGLHVEAIHVVQVVIGCFRNDWQGPVIALGVGRGFFYAPRNDRVADYAHAVGVGDHDWSVEEA